MVPPHATCGGGGTILRASGSLGWLGVEVFFVISGFIIPWSVPHGLLSSRRGRVLFLVRRALRVELPYLASIALVIGSWHAPWSASLILLHVFYLVPFTKLKWLQAVYWTLAFEFAFYLFVALTFSWSVGARESIRWRAMAAVVTIAVYCRILPFHVALFVMGMAVFRSSRGLSSAPESGLTIGICFLAMRAVGAPREATVGAATALLILAAARRQIPGWPGETLEWLGAVSYSLYLTHVPIGGRVRSLSQPWFEDTSLRDLAPCALALIASLAAAWAFRAVIEQPAHALARRVAPLRDGKSDPRDREGPHLVD
ncbi:MAG: acyltransferase family protein [Alphaproteobacteria bacterium]